LLSGKAATSSKPDLIIAIVVTLISIALWILVATGSKWIKNLDYITSFITVVAIAGWIRYAFARRRHKS
jgi:hypothetical protein